MTVLIDNNAITDPAVNQALEEYCLNEVAPHRSCVILYVNDPVVVVGKHQCVFAEVDLTVAQREGIRVIRRVSGGGSVYHDGGNLNFSFVSAFDRTRFGNYTECLKPVVRALGDLGIQATQGGKSDLHINGLKISGNAQYANTRSMLIHGTLLFDADTHRLRSVLSASAPVIAARGVPSIRSAVTRIRDHLPSDMNMVGFVRSVRNSLSRYLPIDHCESLTPPQWEAIYRIADEKYRRWAWNIGRSPWCRLRVPVAGEEGPDMVVDINGGIIQGVESTAGGRDMENWIGRRFEDLLCAVDVA